MTIHTHPAADAASMPASYLGDGLYEMRGLPYGSIYSVNYVYEQFDIRPLTGKRYMAVSAELFDELAVRRCEVAA